MSKPAFSVAVIARNEESTLPYLIASLLPFLKRGGTMVVVDTGSTDKTVAIARAAKLDVYERGDSWRHHVSNQMAKQINDWYVVEGDSPIAKEGDTYFDFAAARNFAAFASPTHFIAMPDCDERYTTLDIDAVDACFNGGSQKLTYPFVFSHYADGSPALQFKHSKIYDRRAMAWKGIVHECLYSLGGPVKASEVPSTVVHLEHYQNPTTSRGQYLTGLSLGLIKEPNDRNAHYLARELMYSARYRSAIQLFNKHITMGGWIPERARSMQFIGDCWLNLGYPATAIANWSRAFDCFPSRGPLLAIARHHYALKEYEKTAAYAAAALQISRPDVYFIEERDYGALPHELLYWAYYYTGRTSEAKMHHQMALSFEPKNAKYIEEAKFFDKR